MALELIQIVEDDPAQAALLDHALRKARFRTNVAHDGQSGLNDIKRLHPALILLDIMLPEMDGYELCQHLRTVEETSSIPIIMLTALGSEEHRVAGLQFGADDYIPKPFSPREVVSRVQAVLRRVNSSPSARAAYLDGQLTLEETHVLVRFRGQRLDLSEEEWLVLRRLSQREAEVVTREELIGLMWAEDGLVHEQELERIVGRLRSKLEDHCYGSLLQSVPGVGYLLKP